MGRWRTGWALGLLLAGCAADPTELVVAVSTDYAVPKELSLAKVDIFDANDALVSGWQIRLVAASDPLSDDAVHVPFSFAVVPVGGDASRTVMIEVQGYAPSGTLPLVVARARTGFIAHRALGIPIELLKSCASVSQPCSSGQTCGEAVCEAADAASSADASPNADANVALDASLTTDSGSMCPSSSSCPNASCPACGAGCDCNASCVNFGHGPCLQECASGSTCVTSFVDTDQGTLTCDSGASCTLGCQKMDTCALVCRGTSPCALSCSDINISCTLECESGPATSCAATGTWVCNRACP
jgi:hypothetical protein